MSVGQMTCVEEEGETGKKKPLACGTNRMGKVVGIVAERECDTEMLPDQFDQAVFVFELGGKSQEELSGTFLTVRRPAGAEQMSLVGAQLYNDETLSVLLGRQQPQEGEGGGGYNQRLVQFPLAQIERYMTPLVDSSAAIGTSTMFIADEQSLLERKSVFDLADMVRIFCNLH